MDKDQNTEAQLNQENGTSLMPIGKYAVPVSHTITVLGIAIVVVSLIVGLAMNVGLGILIVIVNLCSGNLFLEFTKDSLVVKLFPFQKALIIPYRKIKAIDINGNTVKLTLYSNKGDMKKKIPLQKFSKDDRMIIKTAFGELEKELYSKN